MEITNGRELRQTYGQPSERARRKQLPALDVHCRNQIARSPLVVIGSSTPDGGADVSPKGDAPGFVAVLDDRTLLIPDRPGNNRVDTMTNILNNAQVGLLFLVPGMNETLRVNGRARLTQDESLLAPLAVQGKVPRTGLLVEIDEAMLHCGKALIRAKLWDPATQIDRSQFPSLGRILADQIGGMDVAEAERRTEDGYKNRLY